MFNRLCLVSGAALQEAGLASEPGIQLIAARPLPGSYNGGDCLYRVRATSASRAGAAMQRLLDASGPEARAEAASFEDGPGGGNWDAPGIYRALLLSLRSNADALRVQRFEAELLSMPRYIGTIRAWRLSRVQESSGSRPWTHVWEQRYDKVEGLTGAYMMNPYHWGFVDRWFDPESPDWMVDTRLCHSFCMLD
jgi:hypothetical protein